MGLLAHKPTRKKVLVDGLQFAFTEMLEKNDLGHDFVVDMAEKFREVMLGYNEEDLEEEYINYFGEALDR